MNRRLFWKIFLSFWVTQIVFISYLGYKAHSLSRNPGPLWLATAEKTMPLVAKSVLEKYQAGGTPALRQELDQQSVPERLDFWLFDSAGNELSGRPVPPEVKNLYPRLRREFQCPGSPARRRLPADDRIEQRRFSLQACRGVPHSYFLLRGSGLLRLVVISSANVLHNLPSARALPHAADRWSPSSYPRPRRRRFECASWH